MNISHLTNPCHTKAAYSRRSLENTERRATLQQHQHTGRTESYEGEHFEHALSTHPDSTFYIRSIHDVKSPKLRGKVSKSVKRAPMAHSIDAHERIGGRLRL